MRARRDKQQQQQKSLNYIMLMVSYDAFHSKWSKRYVRLRAPFTRRGMGQEASSIGRC